VPREARKETDSCASTIWKQKGPCDHENDQETGPKTGKAKTLANKPNEHKIRVDDRGRRGKK
jgi:hypothetical protein